MRANAKKFAVTSLALASALALTVVVYADDEDKKINKIEFRVLTAQPEAGDSVEDPEVEIKTSNAKDKVIIEDLEFDYDEDEWERGETPKIEFTIVAEDGYYFPSSMDLEVSKNSYKISRRKKVSSTEWDLQIKMDKVGGDLEEIEDVWWDGRTARWEEIDGADKYEVKLYRNSSTVTTVTTSGNSYNLYPYMTRSGDYYFRVRGIDNSTGDRSEWSDDSDEYYMNSSDVYTGAPPTSNTDGGSTVNGPSGSSSFNGSTGWLSDSYGWTYWLNGAMVKSSWIYVDNNWFYLGSNGYMATGWIFVDNNWFYLNPISDGTQGAMKTGWQNIGGFWYYLNPVSDGTRGARKTSYQLINGSWYFLDPTSGAMWANTYVPNGMWADANGVLH